MLKPRIIKKEGCFKCKNYIKALNKQGYEFLIFDADLKENQKQLDEWKIDAMPIVQIVDVKEDGTEIKVYQYPPGRWATRQIDDKIKALSSKGDKK